MLRLSITSCLVLFFIMGCSFLSSIKEHPLQYAFQRSWEYAPERLWVGPDYWANRLQDWRIANGRLECLAGSARKPMRTVHLLTRRLTEKTGTLAMKITAGFIEPPDSLNQDASVGFLVGAGKALDYRAAALIHHSNGPLGGLFAGIDARGGLFIRDFEEKEAIICRVAAADSGSLPAMIVLSLEIQPQDSMYQMTLKAFAEDSQKEMASLVWQDVAPGRLSGSLALVSHPGSGKHGGRGWFQRWSVSGSKLAVEAERNCGPILSTQYTLSKKILKMTAQMMPLGKDDSPNVQLQIQEKNAWKNITETRIIREGFIAPFRVEDWDDTRDINYRVVYFLKDVNGAVREYDWQGTIRHNPTEKDLISIAAFTGNHNAVHPGVDRGRFPWDQGVYFPHTDITRHVAMHKPDLLFFSGDQVYEGASPTRADFKQVKLDYLYKWYLWCWAYRDLTKDIVSVAIPDDHDVYHGNIWGCGGKATPKGLRGAKAHDCGGYKLSPDFVNMVERTQTAHLPDPYDPTPVLQNIGVYYTDLSYGGVSFAVLEDRKFKSAPVPLLPKGKIWNGWPQNPQFDSKKEADVPGAVLLGQRQLTFLEDWAADWRDGIWMKVALSQTIFNNVATLPRGAKSGAVIPKLPILEPGGYPPDDEPASDMDSNGWPQSGRNKALRAMRKGFAIHIAGDQHLGSTIQYGIDDWHDAGFAICVPSVANFWPRRWFPARPARNRIPGAPGYTGDFEDGFGNKFTVHAVSNPHRSGRQPAFLHDRAPGYGIVKLKRSTRKIIFENWPRWANPLNNAKPYPGWPVTAQQKDNYRRKARAYLPRLQIEGMTDPVVQVIEEKNHEIVYTIRIQGSTFRPAVFRKGRYTVKVGEPGTEKLKILTSLKAAAKQDRAALTIKF